MKKLRLLTLSLLAGLTVGASAQVDIIVDGFTNSSVALDWVRFKPDYIDNGWYADSQAPSAWTVADGKLQNNATNMTGAIAEGAVVQMVSAPTNGYDGIEISFDYDVDTNDTLYVHFWGYSSTTNLDANWFMNYQAGGGSLSEASSRNIGLQAYNLKDGATTPTAIGSAANAIAMLTGSGTYSNTVEIAELGIAGFFDSADFSYYAIGFGRVEDGTPGSNSVDNLSIVALDPPPPPQVEGVVWENDMSTDPVGDGWVVRNGNANYTMGGGVLSMGEGAWSTLLDTDPFNGFPAITKVDLRWRNTSHSDPSANYGAGLWLNCDGSAPDYYATIISSVLNTNDNTQTVKIFDPANGSPLATVPGFGTGMIDGQLTIDTYNETLDYILTDGSLSVTGSVSIVSKDTAGGTIDHTMFTPGPSCEIDYVRLEANASPDEVYFAAEPMALSMTLLDSEATAYDVLDITYNAVTNLDVTITITNENYAGSFSVVSDNPLTVAPPGTSSINFEFDRTVHGLSGGQIATGTAVIAWSEAGGGDSGEVYVDLSSVITYAGLQNLWTGGGDAVNWADAANWNIGRVPGALAADEAVIGAGVSVDVATDFIGALAWSTVMNSSTQNVSADFIGGAALTMTGATWNQTAGDAEATALTMDATSAVNLTGGTLAVSAASSIATGAIVDINGGDLILDNSVASFTLQNNGLIKLQSGSLTSPNGNGAMQILQDVEISGGTLALSGQSYFGGIVTINGDAAGDLNVLALNNHSGLNGEFHFNLGEFGVSKFHSSAWMNLNFATIVVDGTNYVGGTRTIPLFTSGNLASTSTAFSAVNFAPDVTTEFTQVMGNGGMYLTITVPGYDGWIGSYDLSGADADGDVDYDLDGEVNFYEYAFGGDPTNVLVKGFETEGMLVEDGGVAYFEYVYPRRTGDDTGMVYTPEFGTSLPYPNWDNSVVVELSPTGVIDANYESVTNRVDQTGKPVGFMHVEVSPEVLD